MLWKDRWQAGEQLAEKLLEYKNWRAIDYLKAKVEKEKKSTKL